MADPTFGNRYVYEVNLEAFGHGERPLVATIPRDTPFAFIANLARTAGFVVTYEDEGTPLTSAAVDTAVAAYRRGVSSALLQSLTIPGTPPAASPPVVESAVTSVDGTTIRVAHSVDMGDPSGQHGAYSFIRDGGGAEGFSAAALDGGDSSIIVLTISGSPIEFGQALTLSYTPGTVQSASAVALEAFSGESVTNNVPDPGGAAPAFSFDPSIHPDMASFEADPNTDVTIGTVTLETVTAPWLGGADGKATRGHFPGGSPPTTGTSGTGLIIPVAARAREMWFRIYISYGGGWIDGVSAGKETCDAKTIFLMQSKPGIGGVVDRWSFCPRCANDGWEWWGDINNNPDIRHPWNYPSGNSFNASAILWDGPFHVIDIHARQPIDGGPTDGIRRIKVDNIIVDDSTGFGTGGAATPAGTVFSGIALGRNCDPGGSAPWMQFGKVEAWNTDPGWSWIP